MLAFLVAFNVVLYIVFAMAFVAVWRMDGTNIGALRPIPWRTQDDTSWVHYNHNPPRKLRPIERYEQRLRLKHLN